MTTPESPDTSRNGVNTAGSPTLNRRVGAIKILIAIAALIVVCILASLYIAPPLASRVARSLMVRAGLADPHVQVDSVGPFFASASEVSFKGLDSVTVNGASGQAGYMPSSIIAGGPVDSATVEHAKVDVDLGKFFQGVRNDWAGMFMLPAAMPSFMEALPSRSVLVRGASLSLNVGGERKRMQVDALSRKSEQESVTSTFSISGDNGDQVVITADGSETDGTFSAEGSFDTLDWLLSCAPLLGFNLTDRVGLDASPMVLQCIVKEQSGKVGKWVGVVSEPWFQYENGPLLMLLQDARAGFTGESDNLIKAAAEADLLLKVGKVGVGPLHPVVSIPDSGDMLISATDVPVTGPGADIKLDYVKVGAKVPVEKGDLSLKGVIKTSWMPVELSLNVSLPSTLDGVYVDIGLPRTKLDNATLPSGWLPSYLEGLKMSGGVDADVFISTGGMTVGGYAASGRVSSDAASFDLQIGKRMLSVKGTRIRNMRFATQTNGLTCELPEGLKADAVTLGGLDLSQVQIWPCRFAFPGDGNMGSATAFFCGGRFIASAAKVRMSESGAFSLASPFDLSAEGVDLGSLAGKLSETVSMDGSADFKVHMEPRSEGGVSTSGSVRTGAFSFALAGGIALKSASMDAAWQLREADIRIDLNRPLLVNALSMSGFSFSGRVAMEGQVCLPRFDLFSGDESWSMDSATSDLTLRVDEGDVVQSSAGLKISGLKGALDIELGSPAVVVLPDGSLHADSLSLGRLSAENLSLVFSMDKTIWMPVAGKISGAFFGGRFSIGSDGNERAQLSFDGVKASLLAGAFPSLSEYLKSGTVSGRLLCSYQDGRLILHSGTVTLDASAAPLDGRLFRSLGAKAADVAQSGVSRVVINFSEKTAPVLTLSGGQGGSQVLADAIALPAASFQTAVSGLLGDKLAVVLP